MGDFAVFLNTLNLGPANTILLVVILLMAKKKLQQHDRMFEWYLGQRVKEKEND